MNKLEEELKKYRIGYEKIEEKTHEVLYQLFHNDIVDENAFLDNSMYYNYMGIYYNNKINNMQKAQIFYEKAIEIDKNNICALYNLSCLIRKKDPHTAIKYSLKCIEHNFNINENEFILMTSYMNIKKWSKGLFLISKLLERKDLRAASDLAIYYEDVLKNISSAKAVYNAAIKLGNEYAKRNLAVLLTNEKDYITSIELLDTIDMKNIIQKFSVYEVYVKNYLYLSKNEKNNEYFEKAKENYENLLKYGNEEQITEFNETIMERFGDLVKPLIKR